MSPAWRNAGRPGKALAVCRCGGALAQRYAAPHLARTPLRRAATTRIEKSQDAQLTDRNAHITRCDGPRRCA
eukprot:CAMPEP_0170308940 /NCGR_PEP_ID=MMETSP0116_2-20130129/54922_1 /TAXON_ID=400756 /ORGANISM="Durinskia baltica, Strain CSIRO CS-38" /LENGTH=71 /DNA_ID=CAMNT_0010561147 /DNA_START=116 /DNA_END=329 /DNA_ORIENTATION=-